MPDPNDTNAAPWNPGILNAARARLTKKLLLLGATGSVGKTTLSVLRRFPAIELTGISVHRSAADLEKMLIEFPTIRFAAVSDPDAAREAIPGLVQSYPRVKFFAGAEGLVEIVRASAEAGVDTVLTAVVGAAGIHATTEAIACGLKIALANKETLVTAGPAIAALIASLPMDRRPVIVPVDSEHNAAFQLLEKLNPRHLSRLILTASGGPFRTKQESELAGVSREEVLNHPNWKMGPKITVDSATMVNKGLEVIEAHFLFSLPYDSLGVFIHPRSVVHAMAETKDGAYLMAASRPHMSFPVAHALFFAESVPAQLEEATPPVDWPALEFEIVPKDRFQGFHLAIEAGRRGGTAGAVFNAANEVAVDLFLNGIIQFTDIPALLAMVLDQTEVEEGTELGLYLDADMRAREKTRNSVPVRSR